MRSLLTISSTSSPMGFELGESAPDGQHRGPVPPERDHLTGFRSSLDEAEAMFERVVTSTADAGVGDVGWPTVAVPLVNVIDLGVVRTDGAARVPGMTRHQLRLHTRRTFEQTSLASHVEHHTVAIDDHPPNMTLHRRLQHVFGAAQPSRCRSRNEPGPDRPTADRRGRGPADAGRARSRTSRGRTRC